MAAVPASSSCSEPGPSGHSETVSPSGSSRQAPRSGDTPEQKRKHTRCLVPWDLSSWLAPPPGSRRAGQPARLGQHSVAPCPKRQRSSGAASAAAAAAAAADLASWSPGPSAVSVTHASSAGDSATAGGGPQRPESSG